MKCLSLCLAFTLSACYINPAPEKEAISPTPKLETELQIRYWLFLSREEEFLNNTLAAAPASERPVVQSYLSIIQDEKDKTWTTIMHE